MKNFKYHKEISSYGFDFAGFRAYENRKAFIWVFEDVYDNRNFRPRAIRTDIHKEVTDWALSFFSTSEKAKDCITKMARKNKLIYKKLGTHTAEGVLKNDDGISGAEEKSGHFNHFEYENVVLNKQFNIIEALQS